VSLAGSNSE